MKSTDEKTRNGFTSKIHINSKGFYADIFQIDIAVDVHQTKYYPTWPQAQGAANNWIDAINEYLNSEVVTNG